MAPSLLRPLLPLTLALLTTLSATPVRAHRGGPSEASAALSALPVLTLVGAPLLLSAGTGVLLVKAVELTAEGSVWVLERSADGARIVLSAVGASALALGQALTVVAVESGWLLVDGSRALAVLPDAAHAHLFHHQALSR
ncbi:hypothetical protein KAK06_13895 [Ideonella sp. 4Y11]|uniref:Uncharacterized protein n=1 Tax=Ideonella aquatica TaxID=2824119 RepID=A0A941BGP4_9BURK|nr:hypothetical protein [Ideonella aquatica]MBQ0960041.1 hypothetical protein [Ideonella aquatica]